MQPRCGALSPNNRIVGYDLARAGALFGMLLVNFSLLFGSGSSDPNWLDWLIGIIRGRAAATFVVLAGAGLSLLTKSVYLSKNRGEINAKRSNLLKRSLFLLAIGLFNFYMSPISDILHFYAVYIALGACLLTVTNSSLWLLTGITITCRPLIFIACGFVKSWNLNTLAHTGLWSLSGIIGHTFLRAAFLLSPGWPSSPWACGSAGKTSQIVLLEERFCWRGLALWLWPSWSPGWGFISSHLCGLGGALKTSCPFFK